MTKLKLSLNLLRDISSFLKLPVQKYQFQHFGESDFRFQKFYAEK